MSNIRSENLGSLNIESLAPNPDKDKAVRKDSPLELIENNSSMKVDEITITSLENAIKDMVEAAVTSPLLEKKNSTKEEEILTNKESDFSDFIYIQSPILNTSVSQDQTAPRDELTLNNPVQAFKKQMKVVEPNDTQLEGADEDGFTLVMNKKKQKKTNNNKIRQSYPKPSPYKRAKGGHTSSLN